MPKAPIKLNTFNTGVLWNMGAFGLMALIGILMNILILRFYSEEALGVFNQVYAIYILLSQLAVGGVHLSVQEMVPRINNNLHNVAEAVSTALLLALLSSLVVVGLSLPMSDTLAALLQSGGVAKALPFALPGLIFFSLNKVLISGINGIRHMKTFAVLQLSRFLLMLIVLLGLLFTQSDIWALGLVLSLPEPLLFLVILALRRNWMPNRRTLQSRETIRRHFQFGNKALTGNFLLDVNTKVDVFILGFFLDDAAVGLYSFAATVAEGFMQLPVLLRNNFNPIITAAHRKGNTAMMGRIIKRNVRSFYKILLPLGLISILFFPVLPLISGSSEWLQVSLLYAILVGCLSLTAGYQPLLMLFNQCGKPALQSWFIFWIFLANLLFNLALVPLMGVYGSALGTGLSFFVQVWLTRSWSRGRLQIPL
jgi:O-antigen/teichoic acid export membrane protein